MDIGFFNVFVTVFSLIVLAAPGFILAKAKMLPSTAGDTLSTLVLYGAQPIMLFVSFQKVAYRPEVALNMLIVAAIALVVHLVMIGLVCCLIRVKQGEADFKIKNVVRMASIFSNCGYMGLPFLQMLFTGEAQGEILIYGAVVISIFNLIAWSCGIYIITGDKKQISAKKALLNPTLIGMYVGLALFLILQKPLTQIAVGSVFNEILVKFMNSMDFLSNLVTPLSMIVIGIRLANVSLKELFLSKWAYLSSFLKLIVMSLITILAVAFLPISHEMKSAIFFMLSMPSATITTLFAIKFGGNSDFGSVCVLLSSLLSVCTIPLMYLIFDFLV